MKAVTFRKYGPPSVLKVEEVPKPQIKANQVLIKVHASSISAGDCELRRFDFPGYYAWLLRLMFGLFKPNSPILGQELSGVIEEVGTDVEGWKVGDKVWTNTTIKMGGYAEFIALPANKVPLTEIPENVSFEQAACIPVGGINSLHFLEKVNITSDMKILIIGSGGSIGSSGIQLIKNKGCHITAVDSGVKLNMLKEMGADEVIDYQQVNILDLDDQFDVIFDVVGAHNLKKSMRLLKEGGTYLLANPNAFSKLIYALRVNLSGKKKVVLTLADHTREGMDKLNALLKEGKLKAHIDRRFTMDQMVEAHEYVEKGLKVGCAVLTIVPE